MLPKEISLTIPVKRTSFHNESLHGSQADLFLTVGEHIFPIHRSQLTKSYYVMNQIPNYEVVHIITQPINPIITSKVLSLFYGSRVLINKMKDLDEFLDVVDFFQIDVLKEEIEQKISVNFLDYEIFPLLELAYKYNLHEIFKLGMTALEQEQFEQINYNKFQFIHCDFILFQIVLRRHHRMKISEKIEGLSPDAVEEVIKLYCSTNKYDQDTLNKLKEKYVKSLVAHGLMKLDKILNKQMLQSGIYSGDSPKIAKIQSETTNTEGDKSKKNQRARRRKYSCNVMDAKPDNWCKFKDSVQIHGNRLIDDICIPEENEEIKEKEIQEKRQIQNTAIFYPNPQLGQSQRNPFDEDKSNHNLTLYDLEREKQKMNQVLQNSRNISQEHFSVQELNENTQAIVDNISGLIDQYYAACKIYSGSIKQKLSTVEDSGGNRFDDFELPKTARFTKGFKLTNTMQIPNSSNRFIEEFDE